MGVNCFTHRVQNGAFIRIEHVAADNRRGQCVFCESKCAKQTFGLDHSIIIKQQDIVRVGVLEHLVHAAREATGTTQVCLLDDTELASQLFLQTRVTLAILHVLIALIDNENLGNVVKDLGFCLEALSLSQAVFGKVIGGNAYGHIRMTVTFARRYRPGSPFELNIFLEGSDFGPDPATVTKTIQRDIKAQLTRSCASRNRGEGTTCRGTHNLNNCPLRNLQSQTDVTNICPTLPVRSREGIEVSCK